MGTDRRTLTILFTDVVGSTALSAEHGDAHAEAILERSARIVREAVIEQGGREVKTLGDGSLCTFPAPRAAIAAADAAQREHAAWLVDERANAVPIRIGIHTGEVTETEDDVRGEAVNAAARICAHAGGGETLVSATTQGAAGAGAGLRLTDHKPIELQGFPEPFAVATAEWREQRSNEVTEQRIRFAEVEGHRIAWSEVGHGPPLVIPAPWVSNVHNDWESPSYRGFVGRLAGSHRVIRYDRPGTGLSDRHLPEELSLDHDVLVLEGLITELELGPVALLGLSAGGCVAAGFAARNPAQTSAIVFYGCYRKGSMLAPPAVRESLVSVIRASWGLGARMLSDIFVPEGTAAEREEWAAFQRDSADADAAADLYELVYSYDATRAVEHATAPALVLHRRGDAAVPFKLGRELASRLPDSRFVPLEGRYHLAWQGDTESIAREALSFLAEHATVAPERAAESPEPAPPPSPGSGGPGLSGPINVPELSPRELEVLRLVGEGLSDRGIAARLVLSPHTVHRHVANIRTKLGQPSRAAAAAYAARLGLI